MFAANFAIYFHINADDKSTRCFPSLSPKQINGVDLQIAND